MAQNEKQHWATLKNTRMFLGLKTIKAQFWASILKEILLIQQLVYDAKFFENTCSALWINTGLI